MDFTLADDPAYSAEEFVRARDIQINVKLWPLFKKELQIKKIILNQPVISVIRNRNGAFNFSTIGKKEQKEDQVKEDRKREKKPPAAKEPAPLLISLVDISGGDLRYRDLKDGADLRLQQVDLKVADLDFAQPISVE